MSPTRQRPPRERGSMSVEAAVLAPALLLLLAAVIAGGRIALAHNTLDHVAHETARIAATARTSADATTTAVTGATGSLQEQDLACTDLQVTLDTTGFATPTGTAASIPVQVTCTLRLSDVAIPGLPGSITLHASATRALDTYRERG
ncbi:TadE/TadG family type IV pilus assembly protein [Salana multivorans]